MVRPAAGGGLALAGTPVRPAARRRAGSHARLDPFSERWRAREALAYRDLAALRAVAAEPTHRRLFELAGLAEGDVVLDAGCGPGVIARLLLDAGAGAVLAVDESLPMLDRSTGLPPALDGRTPTHLHASLSEPLALADASVDLVWMADCVVPESLPELLRVSRDGGRLAIVQSFQMPGMPYAFDPDFEARVWTAQRAGFARRSLPLRSAGALRSGSCAISAWRTCARRASPRTGSPPSPRSSRRRTARPSAASSAPSTCGG